jgi:Ca2+-binding EF-hand superfamily protein
MKGLKILMVIVAGAMIFGCATTTSQTESPYSTKLCEALDQNCNGVVDRDEFLAGFVDRNQANQLFNQCDLNRDGVLSKDELEQCKQLIQNTNMKQSVMRLVGPR